MKVRELMDVLAELPTEEDVKITVPGEVYKDYDVQHFELDRVLYFDEYTKEGPIELITGAVYIGRRKQ